LGFVIGAAYECTIAAIAARIPLTGLNMTVAHPDNGRDSRGLRPLPKFIFASRWLQLPLYLGLIAAQVV